MTDLRDELNHHRRGEDSRITIERRHERRRNIEGRNLERDFESLAPSREALVARVMRPPSSPTGSGGVYGACTTSSNGGMAAQVAVLSTGEV
jgi:hypothetical protein